MISTETRAESYWQSDVAGKISVPVARPHLPTADKVVPYLRRIDQARWYSNNGPLVQEFEERLATHFGGGAVRAATVANATIGLAVTLIAHELPAKSLCMVPAWTFAASAHAISLAGLTPWIVDVSLTSWALEPDSARELLRRAPGKVSAVMAVSPFGAPIDYAKWESFHEDTGIVVVHDAAAALDTVCATTVPAVVSLHATKLLGVGEGGFVLTNDTAFVEEIHKRTNFGFWNSRESTVRSINGKISEYAAAVGIASLDSWATTRADFERVARAYREAFRLEPRVVFQEGFGNDWVSSTVIIAADADAALIGDALAANGIGSRRWWGGGLHRHAAFENFPSTKTENTDLLVDRVIGLPCWSDLPNEKIEQISEIVSSVLR